MRKTSVPPQNSAEHLVQHYIILANNMRCKLIRTLEDFSDRDRQKKYKQVVPFVHIPRELLAQWDAYSHFLRVKQDWFFASMLPREIAAMKAFDAQISAFTWDKTLPDVPEILDVPNWVRLMHGAGQLLIVLKSNWVAREPSDYRQRRLRTKVDKRTPQARRVRAESLGGSELL